MAARSSSQGGGTSSTPAPSISVMELRSRFKAGQPKEFPVKHIKRVTDIQFSRQGGKLATCSSDGAVHIYRVEPHGIHTSSYVDLKRANSTHVSELCWNPVDENQLAAAAYDRCVRFYDLRTKGGTETSKWEMTKPPKDFMDVSWSPDGNYVTAVDEDNAIYMYDVRKTKLWKRKPPSSGREIIDMAWSPNSQYLFLGGAGSNDMGFLELHQVNYKSERTLSDRIWSTYAHSATVATVKVDPLQRYLALGSHDGLVSVWDLNELVCLRTSDRATFSVRAIDFSHDGSVLAVASDDTVVDIVDVETCRQVFAIETKEIISKVSWHPTRNILAYGSGEKWFHIFDATGSGGGRG